jgi:hypothetical protein
MDMTCIDCKKLTVYPDRIFDTVAGKPVYVWHTACWNAAHPDEQYSDDIRLGYGHRGDRST